jgi:hypothetical protein
VEFWAGHGEWSARRSGRGCSANGAGGRSRWRSSPVPRYGLVDGHQDHGGTAGELGASRRGDRADPISYGGRASAGAGVPRAIARPARSWRRGLQPAATAHRRLAYKWHERNPRAQSTWPARPRYGPMELADCQRWPPTSSPPARSGVRPSLPALPPPPWRGPTRRSRQPSPPAAPLSFRPSAAGVDLPARRRVARHCARLAGGILGR